MIVHVIDTLRIGGAERVLVDLVCGLAERGVPVSVCVTRTGLDLASELPASIPILVLRRKSRWNLIAVREFADWCRTIRASVLHAHGRSSAQFAALAKLLYLRNTELVIHDHFGRIRDDRSVPVGLGIIARRLTNAYVCVSPELAEWAESQLKLPREKIHLVPNGVNLRGYEASRRSANRSATNPDVLYAVIVANLRPEKDHQSLLEGISGSPLLRSRLRVTCVGDGVDSDFGRQLIEKSEQLGLIGRVAFTGPRRDRLQIMVEADFGIICSRSEAGPIASVEYMASSLPFVTTRTGQVVAAAERVGACLAVPVRDPDALRHALETMVAMSSEQRAKMGHLGRELAGVEFNSDRQIENILSLYSRTAAAMGPDCEKATDLVSNRELSA